MPDSVSRFLGRERFAVAGVSRNTRQPANAIYRKLRDTGYEVVPVNPNASAAEGATCYPDLAAVPGQIDGVVVATHPDVSADVSEEAIQECDRLGLQCIVGGCPLMYCEPVDIGHRCMRWWLRRRRRVPS